MSETKEPEITEAKPAPPRLPWQVRLQVIAKDGQPHSYIYNLFDADMVWFGSIRLPDEGKGRAAADLIIGRSSVLFNVQSYSAASIQVAFAAAEALKKTWADTKAIPTELNELRNAVVRWRALMREEKGNPNKITPL